MAYRVQNGEHLADAEKAMVSSVAKNMVLAHHRRKICARSRASRRANRMHCVCHMRSAGPRLPPAEHIDKVARCAPCQMLEDGQALQLRQRRQARVEALTAQRVLQAQLQPQMLQEQAHILCQTHFDLTLRARQRQTHYEQQSLT